MLSQLAIMGLIVTYSQMFGVSPEISLAVADVESRYNSDAIGPTGDIGVFQLRPSSFPKFTKKQLLNPYINIPLGIKYLSKLKKTCKHKLGNDFLVCWNYGIKNAEKVKYPRLFPFVKKVNNRIKEMKSLNVCLKEKT